MHLTPRELAAAVHGIVFGGLFLVAFSGGLVALYSVSPEWAHLDVVKQRFKLVIAGVWGMAVIAWATVITGTFFIYPWYRATPPEGADLTQYPRSFLLASANLAAWHKFGMEWKEHVGWITPIAATVVAYLVSVYGTRLAIETKIRRALVIFFVVAFVAAGVAGLLGAFITKFAPVR